MASVGSALTPYLSTASGFPLVAKKFPNLRIPKWFFFYTPHFGTGVILATAFIHLLPTTFISLTNPCLGTFWTTSYPAIGGAIAMGTLFIVAIVEMFLTLNLCSHHYMPEYHLEETGGCDPQDCDNCDKICESESPAAKKPTGGACTETTTGVSRLDLSPDGVHKKAMLQLMMLEVGILFHSIFIGMTVSVTVGHGFIVLLIAVIFHQTFEGLALGARIVALAWAPGTVWTPWLMAFAYGFTMPVGQAIGLATYTLYSPNSPPGLLLVGILSSISAGMLLFAGLAEMFSEDFLSKESWERLPGRKRVYAGLWLFAGAFGMSVVGAWA